MNPSTRFRIQITAAALLTFVLVAPYQLAQAATPAPRINYQGVLRDAAGDPLDGAHEMTFRFFSLDTGGVEILTDTRAFMTPAGPVVVANGLFNASLGDGVVADGSGPGTYTDLAQVFRDYGVVWLEIQIGVEMLAPRVLVTASAYALNASNLEGKPAASFLDTSSAFQTKTGPLQLSSTVPGPPILSVQGGSYAGRFWNSMAGGGEAHLAPGATGIEAFGSFSGARFWDSDGTGEAFLGTGDIGVEARGSSSAGSFYSVNGAGSVYLGAGETGVYAFGAPSVYGVNTTNFGIGAFGYGDFAVAGSTGGGPTEVAGYFSSYGYNTSVQLGLQGEGVHSRGATHGGYFESSTDPYAKVWLAGDSTAPGCLTCYEATWGIWSEGGYHPAFQNGGGGFFKDSIYSGYAKVGHENYGIQGFGNSMGGYFKDTDSSGEAHVASSDRGIYAFGTFVGGAFSHPDLTSFWANVATATHKIQGTGAVSFVQNHPHDPDKVIVYSSPEGDEVATYTRGTARLSGGQARVPLGATFPLVTNPDVGLTAHLTPHGDPVPLAVAGLSTQELIVTGPPGSNAVFDFLVHGLRIGFEDAAVVKPKEREAGLPPPGAAEADLQGEPSLKAYRAFERFSEMERSAGRASAAMHAGGRADSTPGASALREAIAAAGINDVGRRKSYGPEMVSAEADPQADKARREVEMARRNAEPDPHHPVLPRVDPAIPRLADAGPRSPVVAAPAAEANPAADPLARGRLIVAMPGDGPVQPFDLVAAEGRTDGTVRAASQAADRSVVGIALERRQDGDVDVIVGGIAMLRVDAAYGAILTGDLLSASATPGHAMRTPDAAPGTVVAKALEPMEAGTGVIRVLVIQR